MGAAHATPQDVARALGRICAHGRAIEFRREGGELRWRLRGYRFRPINSDLFDCICARLDMLYAPDDADAPVNMQGTAMLGDMIVYRETILRAIEHIVPN